MYTYDLMIFWFRQQLLLILILRTPGLREQCSQFYFWTKENEPFCLKIDIYQMIFQDKMDLTLTVQVPGGIETTLLKN